MDALLIALALLFGPPVDRSVVVAQSIVVSYDASTPKPVLVKIDDGAIGINLGDKP